MAVPAGGVLSKKEDKIDMIFPPQFFLKNKRAELKISAFDILNKTIGVSRNVSQNQIVDQSYNVINQYFLVGFTYSLQKSGLAGGGGPRMTFRM
jgi:hypothetical protein